MGWYALSMTLGMALGSSGLGFISQLMGYQALFIVSAISALISLLYFTFFVNKRVK